MAIELRKTGDKHRINLEKTKVFQERLKSILTGARVGL